MSGPVPPAGSSGDAPGPVDPTAPPAPEAGPSVVVPAPSHGDTGATHTERIPIRTHSSARSDAVTESDATTEVTPAARASDAESDTADLPPVGAASTATGVAAAPETASAETASADTYSTGEPLGPPRDPVLVHLLWEGLLLVTLIGLAVAGLVLFPEFRSFDAARRVLAASVFIGIPAMAFSLSLRGAVPNLAVVPLAALGGSVFAAAGSDQGVASGVLQAATLTGIVGLVMGALVVGLRVPSWAASIAGALLAAGLAPIIASGPDVTPPSAPGFLRADWPMFVVFAVLSVGTGLLCLVPRVRRTLGAYREDVELGRRGLVAGFAALAVLIVSSAVAGLAGVLTLLQTNVAGSAGGTGDLLFPLAAVLLGGASVYGRRVGVAGTLLGVLILVTVQHLWLLSGVGAQYSAYGGAYALAGVAAIVGLLATPLVEWAGRRAEARSTT